VVTALGALEREVVEERLVHFVERRRGICGLVHVEAPRASADLDWVLIRRWLREPRRGRLVVNPIRFSLPSPRAGVAQLAERQPSKLHVAGSNPVSRSNHAFAVVEPIGANRREARRKATIHPDELRRPQPAESLVDPGSEVDYVAA
jgi:hypothetical protein